MAKLSPDQLDPRNNLQLYSSTAIKNADIWTPQTVRSEYSRLRSIARKRLERLAVEEPESYAYRHNKDRYAPVKEMTLTQMKQTLPELARFVVAKTSTVRGVRKQRERSVKTLQAHGYTGITTSNVKAFGEFMDEWRAKKLDRVKGSPTVVDLFEFSQLHEIPWEVIKEDFARWLQHEKKLETYVKKQTKKGRIPSADDILEQFEVLEGKRRERNKKAAQRYRDRVKKMSEEG